jgi:hypothetical protein
VLGPGAGLSGLFRKPRPKGRRRGREHLPKRFARVGLDAPLTGRELELERAVQQSADVLGLGPLAGIDVLDEDASGACVRV